MKPVWKVLHPHSACRSCNASVLHDLGVEVTSGVGCSQTPQEVRWRLRTGGPLLGRNNTGLSCAAAGQAPSPLRTPSAAGRSNC